VDPAFTVQYIVHHTLSTGPVVTISQLTSDHEEHEDFIQGGVTVDSVLGNIILLYERCLSEPRHESIFRTQVLQKLRDVCWGYIWDIVHWLLFPQSDGSFWLRKLGWWSKICHSEHCMPLLRTKLCGSGHCRRCGGQKLWMLDQGPSVGQRDTHYEVFRHGLEHYQPDSLRGVLQNNWSHCVRLCYTTGKIQVFMWSGCSSLWWYRRCYWAGNCYSVYLAVGNFGNGLVDGPCTTSKVEEGADRRRRDKKGALIVFYLFLFVSFCLPCFVFQALARLRY